MTDTNSPAPVNSPEARDPTGALLDPALTATPPTTTPTQSPTPSDPNAKPADPAPKPNAAPDAYTFKAPEGVALDKTVIDSATPIFRELGLDNAQAQRLVDFYASQAKTQADGIREGIVKMGQTWADEFKANPKLGPHEAQIKADVGRALDVLDQRNPGLKSRFSAAMDQTMVGNHPGFIEAFWEFSKAIGEGKPVTGTNPSPNGQSPDGQIAPNSPAARMYPHLVNKAS